jgi:menaquinone-dependent protoporphyrinogen oxidase
MDIRVLVAYATKYGATAEIAERIGQVLRQAGLDVDVLPVDRVDDLPSYKAVVLGSAVYIGAWRGAAARFLEANEGELAGRRPGSWRPTRGNSPGGRCGCFRAAPRARAIRRN